MSLINIGAGLSALGEGVAKLGGGLALEQQKSMLHEQGLRLADQLAGEREHVGRVEAADIAEKSQGREFAQQTWLESTRQTGENTRSAARISGEKERTVLEQAGAKERTQMQVDAPPPDVRLADWYAKASPKQRRAYQEGLMAKAGIPPSLIGGGDIDDIPDHPPQPKPPEQQGRNAPRPSSPEIPNNLFAAKKELGLTPEEENLYQHHLGNLHSGNAVQNPDGSRSTAFSSTFEHDGKTYVVPTIWDGKKLTPDEAWNRATEKGIDKFPAYASEAEADARYGKMHDYMEKDLALYDAARAKSAGQAVGSGKIDERTIPDAAPPLPPEVKDSKLPLNNKYNEEALKGVDSGTSGIIKQMVEGRMAPPTSFAQSKPYWQAMMRKANEYDPTFDAATWASRVKTRVSFSAGPDAANINSANTALGHAERLYDNFDKMGNMGGLLTPLNTPFNATRTAFGSASVTNVETDVRVLASEARKVFAGTGGGGLEELRGWEKSFPVNGSPAQQKGALREFSDLLASRLNEMAEKYNRGMGTAANPLNLLNPKAQGAFRKISGDEPPAATGFQRGNDQKSPAPSNGEGWSIRPIQ